MPVSLTGYTSPVLPVNISFDKHTFGFLIIWPTIAKSWTPSVRSKGSLSWHAHARIYWCASRLNTIWPTGQTKNRILSVLPGPAQIRISAVYQARPEHEYYSCYQPDSNPDIIRATRPSGSRRSLGTTTKILGRINLFCEPDEPTFPRSHTSF